MKHKIPYPENYEYEILYEGQEYVGDVEDEEIDGGNGSTESDSSATHAESPSGELSPRLLPTSTALFSPPTLAKKASRGIFKKTNDV